MVKKTALKVVRTKRRSKAKTPKKAKALKAKEKKGRSLKELLKLRESINDRRPEFVMQESWRYKRIGERWRKPKGIDSKMRLGVKGWPKLVKVGYRGPRVTRGLHPSGYRDVLVNNMNELQGLNSKTDAARLASRLGAKKRSELIGRAKELGIRVLNPKGIREVKKPSE
ncbi:MAG: 50S ribosomal protein L32e [Nitrososphaerales archaeon]|nr:50S ribosomal protein L32e [Nitrososphaerales archaeon]